MPRFDSIVGSASLVQEKNKTEKKKPFTTFLGSFLGGRGGACGAESLQKSNRKDVSNCLSLRGCNLVDSFLNGGLRHNPLEVSKETLSFQAW